MAVINFLLFIVGIATVQTGILYPRESKSREKKELNGIWDFRIVEADNPEAGFRQKWYSTPLAQTGEVLPMPVPSSFNDITENATIRDHVGWVFYDTHFYVPLRWSSTGIKVFLRFGGVNYNAVVWLNGVNVFNHSGGHLPFQGEVTRSLKPSFKNRLTVAINNTLSPETIPQGEVTYNKDTHRYPKGYYEQSFYFDFFNYAGIHRPVYLYTTPVVYIDDITITTDIVNATTGIIYYNLTVQGTQGSSTCKVEVYDKLGTLVQTTESGLKGSILVPNANFWWPFMMHTQAGYLYTVQFTVISSGVIDVYSLPVGIRTVEWNKTSFLINHENFYFKGFGKHEDFDFRGRGVDYSLIAKDFNLIRWLGANAFRTSHYPYAEEIMDQADAQGIVVIDESPAVGLDHFDDELLGTHLRMMTELVQRDKNRPSVVMWSTGNEPKSNEERAGPYFKAVVEHTKSLDPSRPVTLVLSVSHTVDKAAQYLDIICVNRYFAWYSDTGQLEVIQPQVQTEFTAWFEKFQKPVLISEYGAGSISGLHQNPSTVFTEDYQVELMQEHFKAFDILRNKNFFIGELIWNFADFLTPQENFRPLGCVKGVLTRNRHPKSAAYILRQRYWELGLTNASESLFLELQAEAPFNKISMIK